MRGWIGLLLLAAACDGADTETGGDTDDTGDPTGCPAGLSPAASSGMTFARFSLDGLDRVVGHDAAATYEGVPAACIDAAGTRFRLVFEQLDEPYGTLEMEVPDSGSFDLNSGTGTLVLDLHGETEPVTFELGEWQSGTWYVPSVGSSLQLDLNGTAVDSGRQLVVDLSAEATP